MDKHITVPMKKETVATLKAGDYVYLTGTVYTARDAAHKRMYEILQEGGELPIDIQGQVIYYMGHIPGKRCAAQGALPGGKFVQAHTSSLWSSMGAVAPPWAFMYSSKFVNFCCGGRRLMSTRPGSSSFAAG